MPTKEKNAKAIISFFQTDLVENNTSHDNDPFVVKKVEKARETILRVGLPGDKKK